VAKLDEQIKTFAGIVGDAHIKTDDQSLSRYSVDGALPKAVVAPADVDQLSEVVVFAGREGLSIAPWGSGSKMSLGNPPKSLDIVVLTTRLNHMVDVDSANLTVTMQAGVGFKESQAMLSMQENRCYLPLEDPVTVSDRVVCSERTHIGAFVPFDPMFSESATIGGILATNSTGPRRLLYGMPRDLVLGVRFVAPNGDVIGAGGKTVKNVSGYDMSKLMIGSMGTLGIICDMTVRLLPLPERMETLLVSFKSLREVFAYVDRVFETKLLPAAVEVMNGGLCQHIAVPQAAKFENEPFIAAFALEGVEEQVARLRKDLLELAKGLNANNDAGVEDNGHGTFWSAVSNAIPRIAAQTPDVISLQLNYPISQRAVVAETADKECARLGLPYTLLTHTGNGVTLLNLLAGQDDGAKAVEAANNLFAACQKLSGNMIVLRCPAGLKSKLPVWGQPGAGLMVMKRIKQEVDPKGVMNPGRFVV